ncbi:tau 95 subunit of transcription factor TFIIIC [Lithohypha guttulata]|nr:tau 95 subunit of transcription factor TFIIIC [Lithohypha guttulata]
MASTFDTEATTAPQLTVPVSHAISVEHPCIVKNVEKAIDMIGGAPAITQALEEKSVRTFALSFNPQDPAARTILANRKEANNVLLKITVPRRTGRKRKRGSNDPWTEDVTAQPPKKDASYLVHAMHDNPASYSVTAVSNISSMHIWRSMPDFVFSTSQIKIVQDLKSKVLSQNYPQIKSFRLPRTYGLQDTTTLPPAVWSNALVPHNYTYRQNPSVTVTNDPLTGKTVVKNTQSAPKIYSYQVQWDTPEYPTTTMPGIPPIEGQSKTFQATVAALETLFQQRPIWTRRALLNSLDSELSSFNVTIMLQLIPKYGVSKGLAPIDPTKKAEKQTTVTSTAQTDEPPVVQETTQDMVDVLRERRKQEYQTIYARYWARSDNNRSHIFDGVSPIEPDGKVWQLCDITDPQIASLRDVPDIHVRKQCENRYFGWYLNGTNAKIRVMLKAKVDAMREGSPLDPVLFEGFVKLPEKVGFSEYDPQSLLSYGSTTTSSQATAPTTQGLAETHTGVEDHDSIRHESLSVYLGDEATKQQLDWAALYRSFARSEPGTKPVISYAALGVLRKKKPIATKASKAKKQKGTSTQSTQDNASHVPDASNAEEAIDVDAQIIDGITYVEDMEVEDGQEVLPSIEVNGFDLEVEDDFELGLGPEIKLEEEDDVFYGNQRPFTDDIDPSLEMTQASDAQQPQFDQVTQ